MFHSNLKHRIKVLNFPKEAAHLFVIYEHLRYWRVNAVKYETQLNIDLYH